MTRLPTFSSLFLSRTRVYNGQISVNTERNSWDNTMKKWDKYYEQYNVYDPQNKSLSYDPTKGQTGPAISATRHVNKKIEIVINVYSVGNEEKIMSLRNQIFIT